MTTRSLKNSAADDYLRLVMAFPLRPIRSATQFKRAQPLLDELAMKGTVPGGLSSGEADYLEVLSDLVEKYEQAHPAFDLSEVGPREALKHLVEAHGMSASDLGRLLGNRTLGSKILSGQRALSKMHIRKLAEHFGVGPELFL